MKRKKERKKERKINSRRRALKQFKNSPTVALKSKIKTLNTEIKNFFFSQKKLAVRRDITPGSTLSLWSAVKIARDVNVSGLPGLMYLNNQKIDNSHLFYKY